MPTWISIISTMLVFNLIKFTTSLSFTKLTIFFFLIRLFSVIIVYVRNIFAVIRLQSFLLTSMKIKLVLKKLIKYFRKLTHILWKMSLSCVGNKLFCNRKSFVWPNYYVFKKYLWEQNHESNENFKVTIKFGAYIFLNWHLKEEEK